MSQLHALCHTASVLSSCLSFMLFATQQVGCPCESYLDFMLFATAGGFEFKASQIFECILAASCLHVLLLAVVLKNGC
eukprot:1048196-Pelagomonas_calceolata.AAC.14